MQFTHKEKDDRAINLCFLQIYLHKKVSVHLSSAPDTETPLSSYLRHMVGLHVVYDEVLLRKLNFQQLDTVQQLLPLDQLAGHFLGTVPLLVGRGDVLGRRHGCLQADVLRLQVQGAGDVGCCRLRLVLLGRHFVPFVSSFC